MYPRVILSLVLSLLFPLTYAVAQAGDGGVALQNSVEQLRGTIGRWDVTTQFLNADGTAASPGCRVITRYSSVQSWIAGDS